MRFRSALILFALVMMLSACARRGPSSATTQPPITDPALLPLDQIEPQPVLPKPTQATVDAKPSLEAIELYARARAAMLERQRRTAVSLLEKAIELDPHSFELHYALGRAQSTNRGPSERAVASYLKAAEINPDHVELQSELGRQYMLQDDIDSAIHHLRLALQSSGYRNEEEQAAIVDLRLARALQQKGYDRASLDAYTRLLNRLQRASSIVRGHPELMYLAQRPEVLYVEIGQLYERRGQYPEALAAYEAVAAHAPGFEPQARVVRTLLKTDRRDDARNRAIALVRETRAGPDAMQLLRDVYTELGNEAGAVEALQKLHEENPSDTIILFALADSLEAAGKPQQAEAMLQRALDQQSPRSIGVIRRLFSLYESRRDTAAAVRLLIESMAADHRANFELLDLWERLLHGAGGRMLRLADLERVDVAPDAQGAKLYWTARIASIWGRESVARTSLEQAVEQPPPYAPAFRELMDQIWLRDDFDDAQKQAESQALIDRAEESGQAMLAAELRGRALIHLSLIHI